MIDLNADNMLFKYNTLLSKMNAFCCVQQVGGVTRNRSCVCI